MWFLCESSWCVWHRLTRWPNVRRAISEPISSPIAMRAIPNTATPCREQNQSYWPLTNTQFNTRDEKHTHTHTPDGSPYLPSPSYLCLFCLSCLYHRLCPCCHSAHCRCVATAAPSERSRTLRDRRTVTHVCFTWSVWPAACVREDLTHLHMRRRPPACWRSYGRVRVRLEELLEWFRSPHLYLHTHTVM